MADEKVNIVVQIKDLASSGLNKIGTSFDSLRAKTNQLSQNLEKGQLLFAGISAGLGFVASAALKGAGAFENWQVSFKNMLGDGAKADKLLKDLQAFGASTPFELPGLVESTKKLLAAGVAAEEVIPTMRTFGNVAAGVGVDVGQLILPYTQVIAKGKLLGDDFKQISNTGIDLASMLAKSMGISKAEVFKLREAGKLTADDLRKAFESLGGPTGAWANMMIDQSQTLNGVMSNLNDTIGYLFLAIGRMLLPVAKEVAKALTNLVAGFLNLPEPIQKIIIFAGLAAGAFVAVIGAIAAVLPWIGAIGAAFALATGPIGIIVAAIGTLGFLLVKFHQQIFNAGKAVFDFNMKFNPIFIGIKLLIGFLDSLINRFAILKSAADKVSSVIGKVFGGGKEQTGPTGQPEIRGTSALDNGPAAIDPKVQEQRDQALAESMTFEQLQTEIAKAGSNARTAIFQKEMEARLQAQKSTLQTIAGMQNSSNATLAAIGKAAALTQIAIEAPVAVAKALSAFPPPFNFVAAAAVGAAMAAQAAQVAGIQLAEGGIVTGRTNAVIGDNASGKEAVIPLEKMGDMGFGGGGMTVNFYGPILGKESDAAEFAEKIDTELYKLRRSGKSTAFANL